MTLIITQSDWNELCEQAPAPQVDGLVLDSFEELEGVPKRFGRGYVRSAELSPGMWLDLFDGEYHQDLIIKAPVHNHRIQITVFLSGVLYFDEVHPNLGGRRSYLSGSGVSPAVAAKHRGRERLTLVDVEIEPELLRSFLLDTQQHPSDGLELLFREDEWKASFYPTVTPTMRSLAQQLWNAPYRGVAKRMYLQAKVLELLSLHFDLIAGNGAGGMGSRLKPETIARLHHAREILNTCFANPPSLSELAQQVGISDRTLQRGFQTLFSTTVVGYLIQRRLEQAETLLRQGDLRVTEVANLVGYEHLGQFAAAFKRRFGITPRECLAGKKAVFRSKADFR